MVKKKIFTKKRGFTLVELLIVIVIVGVLSGLLMLSAGGALDKAEATKIVSDMKNIQSASILYFADEDKWPSGDISLLNPYLSVKLEAAGAYSFVNDGSALKVKYHEAGVGAGVIRKLIDMQTKGAPISVDALGKNVELVVHGQ